MRNLRIITYDFHFFFVDRHEKLTKFYISLKFIYNFSEDFGPNQSKIFGFTATPKFYTHGYSSADIICDEYNS